MLRSSEIAKRKDFAVGPLRVSPSRRLMSSSEGETTIEPRVMQVLLCLVDAEESVVTRETLFEECWGGVLVGDDSINRSVAKLRRALDQIVPGQAEIETIPRTGYRLIGLAPAPGEEQAEANLVSRRRVIAAGTAIILSAGGTGIWLSSRRDSLGDQDDAIHVAGRALRDQYPDGNLIARDILLRETVRRPDDAHVLGLLALAYRGLAETGTRDIVVESTRRGLAAADRALSIDPKEGNALTARATFRPEFGNWLSVEQDLRSILAVNPENFHATTYLTMLLQAVGRAQESWDLNERAIALDPLSPIPQFRRGFKQWIFGREDAAYLAIDRAYQTWPDHSAVWSARMNIYIFTGRADDALEMLRDETAMPKGVGKPSWDYFRALAAAGATRSAQSIERVRDMSTRFTPKAPYFSVIGIMGLSYLGLVDDAYRVADGAYLLRGPLAPSLWSEPGSPKVADSYWRRTMNLFTPAVRAMRLDPRFDALTESMGMKRYWQDSGTRPDAFLLR